MTNLTLNFDPPPMHRKHDHATSVSAAEAVRPRVSALQALVLLVLDKRGPLTDEQLETSPDLMGFAPSTVRKRRSELYQRGLVVSCGEVLNSRDRRMTLWNVR